MENLLGEIDENTEDTKCLVKKTELNLTDELTISPQTPDVVSKEGRVTVVIIKEECSDMDMNSNEYGNVECELTNEVSSAITNEAVSPKQNRNQCSMCAKTFQSCKSLKKHMIAHSGEKNYQCNVCEKAFSHRGTLKYHMVTHTGEKNYKCTLCGKVFTTSSSRYRHLRRHTAERNRCNACGKSLNQLSGQCDQCSNRLSCSSAEQIAVRSWQCAICDRKCSKPGNLKKHMLTHIVGKKNTSCSVCGKKCSGNSSLQRHMLIQSGVVRYQCNTCDRKLKSNHGLKQHMLLHAGVKNYQCTVCKRRFSRSSSLKEHMVTHTGAKKHQCKECGKKFTLDRKLKQHIILGHKVV